MQLTAAAVTPPAEHAARRPAGAADAAAADAGVRKIMFGERMIQFHRGRLGSLDLTTILMIIAALLTCGSANALPKDLGEEESFLCSGTEQMEAQAIAEDWLTLTYGGRFNFAILWWEPLYEGHDYIRGGDGHSHEVVGCVLACLVRPVDYMRTGQEDVRFQFLYQSGKLLSAREMPKYRRL